MSKKLSFVIQSKIKKIIMNVKTLSEKALKVVEDYNELDFGKNKVVCPYFNNRRAKVKGVLNALVGKGSPKEIIEEARLIALRKKIKLEDLDEGGLKRFLIDNNLGIDCSGFAFFVLSAHLKETKGIELKNVLKSVGRGLLGRIIFIFRAIRNINVLLLSHDKNSKKINLEKVEPGDFVSFLNYGKNKDRYHVLIVEKVEYENDKPKVIHYVHSLRWNTDGKYNHGIKKGKIEILDLSKDLLLQKWVEGDGKENETLEKAKNSESVELRRIFV